MLHDALKALPAPRNWVGILQPAYLPWQGFFEQLDRVDVFVVLDHVQFTRRDWRSRNRIMGPAGPLWLTVPVRGKVGDQSVTQAPICAVEIDHQQPWADKHLASIRHSYGKTPWFSHYYPRLEELLRQDIPLLCDLDILITQQLAQWLDIRTPVVRSSELRPRHHKGELIIELCERMAATDYYSGAAAQDYLEHAAFASAGMNLWFQDYQHQAYPQGRDEGFTSHLSVIDLLFHCGPRSAEIVRAGRGNL